MPRRLQLVLLGLLLLLGVGVSGYVHGRLGTAQAAREGAAAREKAAQAEDAAALAVGALKAERASRADLERRLQDGNTAVAAQVADLQRTVRGLETRLVARLQTELATAGGDARAGEPGVASGPVGDGSNGALPPVPDSGTTVADCLFRRGDQGDAIADVAGLESRLGRTYLVGTITARRLTPNLGELFTARLDVDASSWVTKEVPTAPPGQSRDRWFLGLGPGLLAADVREAVPAAAALAVFPPLNRGRFAIRPWAHAAMGLEQAWGPGGQARRPWIADAGLGVSW